jgi:hypothetical protein
MAQMIADKKIGLRFFFHLRKSAPSADKKHWLARRDSGYNLGHPKNGGLSPDASHQFVGFRAEAQGARR